MLNIFIAVNNQELESLFHSFTVENHINCTLRMYQMFPWVVSSFTYMQVSLHGSHDTVCAVKIKELLIKELLELQLSQKRSKKELLELGLVLGSL